MQFKVFDAFAGCGGMSLGLKLDGHEIVAANEVDRWAADTYERNHSDVRLHRCDVRDLSDDLLSTEYRGTVDLVVGGPPCQGFSISGQRQYGLFSEKNQLVHEFIRIVKAIQPEHFVLENVRGFTTASIDGRTRALDHVLGELEASGYKLHHQVLQAADYGLPQFRARLFVIGSRSKLTAEPFPERTHAPELMLGMLPYMGVLDAISDLNELAAGEGSDGVVQYAKPAVNPYQERMRTGSVGIWNHQAMRHSPRLVERFRNTPPGGKGYDLGRKRSSAVGTVTVYKSNNQKLVADRPALCITANFQSNYVHPTAPRNLTAREAARIQTFPDTFVFEGRRTLMSAKLLRNEGRHAENHLSQYNQIGNAVPPELMEKIVHVLADASGGATPLSAVDGSGVAVQRVGK